MPKPKAKTALTDDEIRERELLRLGEDEAAANAIKDARIAEVQTKWTEAERASRTMAVPRVETREYWRCCYQRHAPWETI